MSGDSLCIFCSPLYILTKKEYEICSDMLKACHFSVSVRNLQIAPFLMMLKLQMIVLFLPL
jgi:hypothetical protein